MSLSRCSTSGLACDRHTPRGFTLVEVLIVVVILGILASIITAVFSDSTEEARRAAFIRQLKTYASAAEAFTARTGSFLEDASTGVVPDGFESYVDVDLWTRPTPLGGQWDADSNHGIRSGIGVVFGAGDERNTDTYMLRVDEMFDNGDLDSGMFRQLDDPNRFYYVIAD